MIRTLFTGVALATAAFAPSAYAATSIDCVISKMSPTERNRWGQMMSDTLNDRKPDRSDMSEGQNAIKSCAAEFKWPDAAVRPATAYTVYSLAKPIQAKYLREKGFDPDKIEAAYASLSADDRHALSIAPVADGPFRAMVAALVASGVVRADFGAEGKPVLGYVINLAQTEAAILAFTAA